MSINGSQVLSDIERARNNARTQAHTDESAVEALRARHASANNKLRQAYEKLMQARTKDPKAKRRGLDEVDAWLVRAADLREKAYQQLLMDLTRATGLANQFDEAFEEHTTNFQAAEQVWSDARQSIRSDLSVNDAEFIQAEQRTSDAVRRSQAIDTHLEEISKSTQAFAADCKSDPLFSYCMTRRVGLSDSAGNFITKGLDRLVAKFSGYYENRQLLLDAEQDLSQWIKHQSLLHEELTNARAAVEKALDDALETQAARQIKQALEEASAQLDSTKKARKEAHAKLALIASKKKEFDQEQDPQSKEMRARVFEAISQASDRVLKEAAHETPVSEDDEAAQVVASLRQDIPAMVNQITRSEEKAAHSAEQAKRLDKLVSSFSSRGYDGRYSRFDYGFDTSSLITGVMLGQMSVSQALGRCDSLHRDVTPPPPPPSPSYSSSSNDSSSGGFSSGGGFGGGGGFSTGGGF